MRTKLPKKYTPINPRCAHMLHGGDYNSDQWIRTPEIWDEDMHLMNYTTAKQTVNLGSQPGADLDCVVQYFDRDACRLPDAMWFTISPKAVVNDGWRLDKMGQEISPFDVINRGNRRLHAVRDTVTYNGPEGCCEIIPLDSPLTAPGKGELYDFSCKQPQTHYGLAFNLWNTMWNTNFTMWSEEDQRFRYKIKLESDASTALPDFDDWDLRSCHD